MKKVNSTKIKAQRRYLMLDNIKKYIAVFMTLLCVITMCPQIVYAADEVPQRETVRVGFFEMNDTICRMKTGIEVGMDMIHSV